ncbi:hypothetical protein CANARDRAFT_174840 [[Candida] arabinofermentans NRRL YB-2248]|uniref:Uncharacterized protein n=1 Tax=[Candida] arabinofermentans NRRL YB-2248 TaxID=983967 RepID=A0A1E4T4V7_9ASCO|nr:hypothetical protein CANARDRAFT_174840 [[Candida] arabinofermentans NRRL YB-2248]
MIDKVDQQLTSYSSAPGICFDCYTAAGHKMNFLHRSPAIPHPLSRHRGSSPRISLKASKSRNSTFTDSK